MNAFRIKSSVQVKDLSKEFLKGHLSPLHFSSSFEDKAGLFRLNGAGGKVNSQINSDDMRARTSALFTLPLPSQPPPPAPTPAESRLSRESQGFVGGRKAPAWYRVRRHVETR